MDIISSKQNQIVKYAISLKIKKNCIKYNECLVESEKIIVDLLSSKHKASTLLVDESKVDKYNYLIKNFSGKVYGISPDIATYISDSVTNSGLFAFVKLPNNSTNSLTNFLVLENIQDPTNFGSILRNARAFNYNTIIVLNGVFPYLFKCIRSSMGYVFDVNIIETTLSQLPQILQSNKATLYCADMLGEDVKNIAKPNGIIGIAIGNEGNGVSEELKRISNKVVKISMQNNVESLNASVSSGILMYELSK